MHKQRRVHNQWDWVSPQLLNRKGHLFQNDKDWTWARMLEWAVTTHRDLGEDYMDQLLKECTLVLGTSREGVEMRDLWHNIKNLRGHIKH